MNPSHTTLCFYQDSVIFCYLVYNFYLFRLFGGYEALVAGKAKDAMVDMTGGVAEGIEIKDYKNEEERKTLFKILRKSKENMSLISTSIAVSTQMVRCYYN